MTLKKESLTKGQLFITRVQPYSFKYVRKQQQQIESNCSHSTCGLKNITKKVERTYHSMSLVEILCLDVDKYVHIYTFFACLVVCCNCFI